MGLFEGQGLGIAERGIVIGVFKPYLKKRRVYAYTLIVFLFEPTVSPRSIMLKSILVTLST